MKRNERLLDSIGNIDEKFIEEAEGKMKKKSKRGALPHDLGIGKMVASFIVIVGLGLFLFWPAYNVRYDAADYADSQYQPLIEKIEPYRYNITKKTYDNNFELGLQFVNMIFRGFFMGGTDMAPPMMDESGAMGDAYVESTDNQVSGIIEADIIKTTEKYLFRLKNNEILRIYSLEGENSKLVSKYSIPRIEGIYGINDAEMYLTEDCKTVIVITDYFSKIEGVSKRRVGITSIDVSDPVNPVKIGDLSIDGFYNTSRLVNGKLLLVSEYNFNIRNVDYSNPETFVPRVTRNGEDSYLQMSEIYAPDGINSSRYSVVASVDIENFEISGVNGLLNFTNSVYVSENNAYITREYTKKNQYEDGKISSEVTSDIAVLDYANGGLDRQVLTVSGSIKDQYSMDERDGYLRVVTSTDKRTVTNNQLISGPSPRWQSASLYVIRLSDGSLVASVEDFAPQGEEVASVRFDGDKLYVCTAVVITFTDPVFFFDLSDYSNITYTDTGVIDGFSSSLINLGEGFLLGIGEENWQYSKVEVYEEGAGAVNSVDVFKFRGEYSRDYKDYLVNREENLFGFEMAYDDQYGHSYVLLQFDGYKLNVISVIELDGKHSGYTYAFREFETRGILRDGILYVVTDEYMVVVDTTIPMDEDNPDAQILTVVGIYRK